MIIIFGISSLNLAVTNFVTIMRAEYFFVNSSGV